jgi:hypothetical protein
LAERRLPTRVKAVRFSDMKALKTIAPIVGALALTAAPALAGSDRGNGTPPSNQGTAHKQAAQTHPAKTNTPGPKASMPAKAKAYGRFCQGTSKAHANGSKGTPFSQCVNAMAKLAHSDKMSARVACKALSHKKVAGAKRSDFSTCVSGAAKLRHTLKSAS